MYFPRSRMFIVPAGSMDLERELSRFLRRLPCGSLGGKGYEVMLGTWLRTKLSCKIGRMR